MADFQQRSQRYQTAAQQSLFNFAQREAPNADGTIELNPAAKVNQKGLEAKLSPPEVPEQVGVSRPVWVGDRLLLARRVARNGVTRCKVRGSIGRS